MKAVLRTCATASIVAAGLAAAQSADAAPAGRHTVAASSPQVTRGAVDKGAAAKTAAQSLRIYLAPNGGEDALEAAVAAISDPASATYGKFLTPDQFHAQYDATAAQVKSVKSFLKSEGLTPGAVEAHGRYITATGDASAAEQAFATTLHQYTKNGQTFQAPTATASVPDSVAPDILAVSGLATATHVYKPKQSFPPPAGFVNARPCSAYYGQLQAKYQGDFKTPLPKFQNAYLPYAPCGYQPSQFRSAYEAGSQYNGSGVTVGIVDAYAAPTIEQDADTYATRHGDPAFAAGQLTQSAPKKFTHADECDPSGWYGEETLDVEAVHAMAPAAGVRYYGAQSCENPDLADTLDTVVDENAVSIVSNSYGDTEGDETLDDIVANEQAFQQGAMQGISFLFSSGDDGDEVAASGTLQADYPASDPYITSVGGTSTGIGQDGSLATQTGWGTNKWALSADGTSWTPQGFLYGSGGGFSGFFNRPDYQKGVVPNTAPAGRAYPDVAMNADPNTGMLIGETQTFPSGVAYGEYRIGGTSPGVAADGGPAGDHPAARGRAPGLPQPGPLQGRQEEPRLVPRRVRPGDRRRRRARGLRELARSERRHPLQRAHLRSGLEPDRDARAGMT